MAKKTKKTAGRTPVRAKEDLPDSRGLLADLRELIEAARAGVAQTVYSAQVTLHWRVGHRLLADILKYQRAAYGDQIVATVSRQLTADYGRGFAEKSLRRMIQFADVFPDPEIVAALSRQLSWSHFVEIIPLKTDLHREFYAEMCRIERWGVRTLREKIGGMLFERTALSRKPEQLASQELAKLRETDQLSPDLVFRDPYFLDVRHDNRVIIADSVSRILGRRCLSRPTHLGSKDDRDHSLLVKRWWATKCPDPRAARLAK